MSGQHQMSNLVPLPRLQVGAALNPLVATNDTSELISSRFCESIESHDQPYFSIVTTHTASTAPLCQICASGCVRATEFEDSDSEDDVFHDNATRWTDRVWARVQSCYTVAKFFAKSVNVTESFDDCITNSFVLNQRLRNTSLRTMCDFKCRSIFGDDRREGDHTVAPSSMVKVSWTTEPGAHRGEKQHKLFTFMNELWSISFPQNNGCGFSFYLTFHSLPSPTLCIIYANFSLISTSERVPSISRQHRQPLVFGGDQPMTQGWRNFASVKIVEGLTVGIPRKVKLEIHLSGRNIKRAQADKFIRQAEYRRECRCNYGDVGR